MQCDKCGKETNTTKDIVSKKNGQKYTMFVCESGCKTTVNGRQYDYTFFPPKTPSFTRQATPVQTPTSPTATPLEKSLARITFLIEQIAQATMGHIPE